VGAVATGQLDHPGTQPVGGDHRDQAGWMTRSRVHTIEVLGIGGTPARGQRWLYRPSGYQGVWVAMAQPAVASSQSWTGTVAAWCPGTGPRQPRPG
jgi:hypothetical protein